ncbi:MAG TPA: serine/threonine-protein kinase [Gemmatimonadales bacterium]|nr:serine/threonine-protein kinase [Gemmatimonadales bacterium]
MDISGLQQRLQEALGKQFTVGPLLGQGGFAVVFRTRDHALNRDVAVKVLDTAGAPAPTLSERFVREAQTIARLEHPNIVPIYEVGQQAELLYLAMRCVDGPSLRQLLGSRPMRRLSPGDAARVARAVADALSYAHVEGVVHRDIKPDNILLDKRGNVLVTDFGIAKAAQAATAAQLTTEGMIIGTPQYMSPEQAAGDVVDGRSDIYSLGIVLYQMLSGGPPFDGDSSAKIIAQQLTAVPRDIRELRSDVTPELGAVLARMLAKDPGERFQSAGEVSRALVDALPTAAKQRVQHRTTWFSMFVKSLVGVSLAGCLAGAAFIAGAVVVFWYVLAAAPWMATNTAALPDSLRASLTAVRLLSPGDSVQLAFRPRDRGDTIFFLVSNRRVGVLTPHGGRSYPRDSVAYTFDLEWKGGPDVRYILILPGTRRDTVYPDMTPRGAWSLTGPLQRLLPSDSIGRKVRITGGPR